MTDAPAPFDQSRYQVRFDWGYAGWTRVASSDIVIVVDVLSVSSEISARIAGGESVDLARVPSPAATLVEAAAASGATVYAGSLRGASAVAGAVLAEQTRRSARTSIAVIAVGEPAGDAVTFTAEDLLGAGAVIDALSSLGLDHTSPEAAVACESFRGLRGAVKHLLSATGSGQELLAIDKRDVVLAAAAIDADAAAPVFRGTAFVAA